MRAFVVLGLVFFPYQAKRRAWKNVSEMTHFVSSVTENHDSVNQSCVWQGCSPKKEVGGRLKQDLDKYF